MLDSVTAAAAAQNNAAAIASLKEKSREEVIQAILEGQEASAKFVEGLDEADLATVAEAGRLRDGEGRAGGPDLDPPSDCRTHL
ncbi:hypothetical protein O0235_10745 [Tepidiforma flava]|uniref:Uncharacterized protein n=1 Tax=Tepidiforma flava TaxID=3004094 RepID=A0ABY7M5L8_9CHLR|nr:hypothetical protein [Tepidiforma flava]WBL35263.1 hypothetical protein O0235_10745 [Tepidiforma flava]